MDKIINAKDKTIDKLTSALPDVGGAVQELMQPVIAIIVQKQQIDGYTQEVSVRVETKASIQPFTMQQLRMLPEGQRKWKYYTVYALSNLKLEPDEIFKIGDKRYRILEKTDWSDYGFIKYNIIEDYQNAPE